MAVVSGVVVVALAVGGLWWFKWRDGQDGPVLSGPLLAEMSQPPSLAPVLRVDEIFDGELLEAGFLSAGRRFTIDLEPTRHPVLLDRDTVVAYALGYSFEPALQVAAVDARLGETKWVVDVLGALDQALPDGGFDELARIVHFLLLPDGQGGLLVAVRTQGYAVTLHLGPGGETMGARRGAFATAVAGDLVAFDDLAPDGNTVSVAPLAALDQDLWQAGSGTDPELVVDCPPLTADDGTLLVLTDQGYADGRTGRLLGFGSDHDGDSVRYGMAHSGVVLRRTTQYGESFLVPAGYTWSRLDPATGEELWTVDLQQNDYGAGVLSPDRIVIGPWLNFEPCSPGYNQGLVWDSVLERWLGEGTPGVLAVYEAATGKVAYGVDGAVVDVADSKLMIWQEAPLEPPETYGGYGKYVAFYQRLDVSTGSAESETSWMTDFGAADSCYYSGAGLDVSNPLGMDVWFSVSQSLMTGAPWGISAYDYSGPKGYLRG
ncbi:MAG: hypothetical protein LBR19_01400, partial [Bifidobacteriaceae bacterium]|nr:hypothetical protein [Bifidobacteriaceae bacterium]